MSTSVGRSSGVVPCSNNGMTFGALKHSCWELLAATHKTRTHNGGDELSASSMTSSMERRPRTREQSQVLCDGNSSNSTGNVEKRKTIRRNLSTGSAKLPCKVDPSDAAVRVSSKSQRNKSTTADSKNLNTSRKKTSPYVRRVSDENVDRVDEALIPRNGSNETATRDRRRNNSKDERKSRSPRKERIESTKKVEDRQRRSLDNGTIGSSENDQNTRDEEKKIPRKTRRNASPNTRDRSKLGDKEMTQRKSRSRSSSKSEDTLKTPKSVVQRTKLLKRPSFGEKSEDDEKQRKTTSQAGVARRHVRRPSLGEKPKNPCDITSSTVDRENENVISSSMVSTLDEAALTGTITDLVQAGTQHLHGLNSHAADQDETKNGREKRPDKKQISHKGGARDTVQSTPNSNNQVLSPDSDLDHCKIKHGREKRPEKKPISYEGGARDTFHSTETLNDQDHGPKSDPELVCPLDASTGSELSFGFQPFTITTDDAHERACATSTESLSEEEEDTVVDDLVNPRNVHGDENEQEYPPDFMTPLGLEETTHVDQQKPETFTATFDCESSNVEDDQNCASSLRTSDNNHRKYERKSQKNKQRTEVGVLLETKGTVKKSSGMPRRKKVTGKSKPVKKAEPFLSLVAAKVDYDSDEESACLAENADVSSRHGEAFDYGLVILEQRNSTAHDSDADLYPKIKSTTKHQSRVGGLQQIGKYFGRKSRGDGESDAGSVCSSSSRRSIFSLMKRGTLLKTKNYDDDFSSLED